MVAKVTHNSYGATPEEWEHWGTKLGLGPHLLPSVMNPQARPAAKSGVQAGGFSKIPSMYNAQGLAHGIASWPQKITTDDEIAELARQPDYGIGLQGREIPGLDIDVEDAEQVDAILSLVEQVLGFRPPTRTRASSPRVLLIFRVATPPEQTLRWRGVKTAHGLVELLATGKQFVVAGRHKSGDRYEWQGGLPATIPTISLEAFEALWLELVERFAIEAPREASSRERQRGPDIELPDPVAEFLYERGLVVGEGQHGFFMEKNPLLASLAEGAIAGVAVGDVKLVGDGSEAFELGRWRRIATGRRGADPEHGLFRPATGGARRPFRWPRCPSLIAVEPAGNRIHQRVLKISLRLVAVDPNLAQSHQDGADVLMLELD